MLDDFFSHWLAQVNNFDFLFSNIPIKRSKFLTREQRMIPGVPITFTLQSLRAVLGAFLDCDNLLKHALGSLWNALYYDIYFKSIGNQEQKLCFYRKFIWNF